MNQILVVEDDDDLQNIIQIYLVKSGYSVDTVSCSDDALREMHANEYDLVLMDFMLPEENGDIICQKIRSFSDVPIIFMSCLDDESIVVRALSLGGDDYIVKPINHILLLARIESNIRRYRQLKGEFSSGIKKFRTFSVDTVHHTVLIDKTTVMLSPIEYSILIYFIANPDRLLLYDDIYNVVWNRDSLGDFRTVMVHVSNLRKKIGDEAGNIICTIRGAGYIFSKN